MVKKNTFPPYLSVFYSIDGSRLEDTFNFVAMVVFPNCKINLGLHIIGKRSDGYHELETVMFPVPMHDILEVVPSSSFHFEQSGTVVAGNLEDNICVKAFRLLEQKYDISPVDMYLHKQLPMGAGMGGGSADGTFALQALNAVMDLNLSTDELIELSAQLGSDCPFFVRNTPQLAKGRGEILTEVPVSLKGYYLALLHPPIHISTAEAFQGVHISGRSGELEKLVQLPVTEWKGKLENDFEIHIFERYPALSQAKEQLYKDGAIYASLTGSGSVVYGIFDHPPKGYEMVIAIKD